MMRQLHSTSRTSTFPVTILFGCLASLLGNLLCHVALYSQQTTPIFRQQALLHPEVGYQGMAATQETHATQAAALVLAEGGNAVDAAVTAGFALAVTLPRAGNIGGGGFMLLHDATTKSQICLDYREQAPAKAHRDMFLDEQGKPLTNVSQITHLAAGIPGTVLGLTTALEKYGTISLKRAMAPAIQLAEDGFPVSEDLYQSLLFYQAEFKLSPAAREVFYLADGNPPPVGSRLIQQDLAKTLRLIAEQGPAAFYTGKIAAKIVANMEANSGLISAEDLKNYSVVERTPVTGTYRGVKIVSMPPPSSGGVHLIQMLNILERFPLEQFGHNSANCIHVMAEAMKMAYADRSQYLGDPDFESVPIDRLMSKDYAYQLAKKINLDSTAASLHVFPGLGQAPAYESKETTHFSVVDRWGNAVTNTYTLNFSYGSKLMVPGTGILLNNQMDDFSTKPGEANAFGLIGGRCNAIAPGKRMLSSMTPTFIFREDGTMIATGSPGGSGIINVMLQMVVNVIDHNMSIAEASAAPRFHHQWFPDRLMVENGFSPDTIALLAGRGHKVESQAAMGSTQTVAHQAGLFLGFSDQRRQGALSLGIPSTHEERLVEATVSDSPETVQR